jgi:hypothetical protein
MNWRNLHDRLFSLSLRLGLGHYHVPWRIRRIKIGRTRTPLGTHIDRLANRAGLALFRWLPSPPRD